MNPAVPDGSVPDSAVSPGPGGSIGGVATGDSGAPGSPDTCGWVGTRNGAPGRPAHGVGGSAPGTASLPGPGVRRVRPRQAKKRWFRVLVHQQTKTPATVGSVRTCSDTLGAIVVPTPPAMLARVQSVVPRGRLYGHPIRITIGDNGGSPSKALSLVKNIAEDEHFLALAGSQKIITIGAVEPYPELKNIPAVGDDDSDRIWHRSPILFPASSYFLDAHALKTKIGVQRVGAKNKVGVAGVGVR